MNKIIHDNQHYFKISQQNPEPHLDVNYFFLEKHPELKAYIKGVKDIKEILITIKRLKKAKEKPEIIEKYFQKLFKAFNQKFSNCSELGCFVNACDTTRDLAQKDYNTFKKIGNFFIEKRLIDEKAPENWIQALLDSNSSRRKGDLGEKKLIKILKGFGFTEAKSWEEFANKKNCVARFSSDIFSNKEVKVKLKLRMPFKKQGKKPDLLVKCNRRIFIIEAKHLNVGGGEQDKQISELIDILRLRKERENIFYISFLDGTYSNILLSDKINKKAKKRLKQYREINRYLRRHTQNYWLNTAGFKALFTDLV